MLEAKDTGSANWLELSNGLVDESQATESAAVLGQKKTTDSGLQQSVDRHWEVTCYRHGVPVFSRCFSFVDGNASRRGTGERDGHIGGCVASHVAKSGFGLRTMGCSTETECMPQLYAAMRLMPWRFSLCR